MLAEQQFKVDLCGHQEMIKRASWRLVTSIQVTCHPMSTAASLCEIPQLLMMQMS